MIRNGTSHDQCPFSGEGKEREKRPGERRLTLCSVDILPTVCAAEDVLDLLCLHHLSFKIPFGQDHLVRACAAFEAVLVGHVLVVVGELICRDGCNDEEVGTAGTDF